MLKKIFIGLLVFLIVFIGILALVPLIFKDKLVAIARQEINQQLTAKVDWSDMGVSAFKDFPNISLYMKNLVVVTEGDEYGGAEGVSRIVREKLPTADVRIAILGHIQRGGAPTSIDRYIASRMGFHSIECLLEGTYNVMVGIVNNKMHYTPLDKAVKAKQRISDEWLTICKVLAS